MNYISLDLLYSYIRRSTETVANEDYFWKKGAGFIGSNRIKVANAS